jgi:TPR repeat protein
MYIFGRGVTKDNKEAARWYRKAAEQGLAKAQTMLGNYYRIVSHDDKEAVGWYRKAAEQGQPQSQYHLGMMYMEGAGVAQDYAHAYKWFSIAGTRGYQPANSNRNDVTRIMTSAQIAEARKLVREWMEQHQ